MEKSTTRTDRRMRSPPGWSVSAFVAVGISLATLSAGALAIGEPKVPLQSVQPLHSIDFDVELLSWMGWLAGSAAAIALVLVAFRRRFGRTQATVTGRVQETQVDYDISDDAPTEINLALDANLFRDNGLTESSNSGISPDVSSTPSKDVD